ncbi:MAG: hypothetical protein M3506_09285 [Chloroflexota bacterium]|nr:hypothetical protein [Chloroflexota bacterium]
MVTTREEPLFRGIEAYSDPNGRYTFWIPSEWHRFQPAGDQDGIIFSPYPSTPPVTWFSVLISELPGTVVAEDLEVVREGVDEGLSLLKNCAVESASEDVLNNMLKFERIYTFDEDGVTRKRRVWILYVDRWLMVVAWQGETVEEYQHWLMMPNYSFSTFDISEVLWFASDRTIAGNATRTELIDATTDPNTSSPQDTTT